jgi:citrate lyase gamma subunit
MMNYVTRHLCRTARRDINVALLLIVAASALLITQQVRAQSGIEMQSSATYQFGEQITFVAQIVSPIQVQQANIVIFDEAQAVTNVQPVSFVNGRSEYRFDTRQNLVRPFTTIRWYYELTLSDGNILQSDRTPFVMTTIASHGRSLSRFLCVLGRAMWRSGRLR